MTLDASASTTPAPGAPATPATADAPGVRPAPVGVAHSAVERLGYRPALDGLRAVAVTLVIVGHTWGNWLLPGGLVGVDIFFVLSGFLITTLLLEERARTGRISLRQFYARRALRLLPALAFLLGFVALWVLLADPSPLRTATIDTFPSVILYYSNFYWGFFGNAPGVFGHMWSLSVEEQFYILWPAALLVVFAWRRGARAILGMVLVVIVVAAFVRWELAQRDFTDEGLRRLTKTRYDVVLVGCALALASAQGWLSWVTRRLAVVATVGALAVLAYFAASRTGVSSELLFKGGYTAIALAAAVLVYRIVHEPDGLMVRLLSTRLFVVVGRLSYALYLWHIPLRDILRSPLSGLPSPVRPMILLPVTVLAAAASFVLVERPALRLKDRFTPHADPPAKAPLAGPAGDEPEVAATGR